LTYSNQEKSAVKRLYALNEMDFITTQNINIPANYENYGFVKIFRKKDPVPKLNVKIS
jgi:hypothetical protein